MGEREGDAAAEAGIRTQDVHAMILMMMIDQSER